jgi:hypothetical protein
MAEEEHDATTPVTLAERVARSRIRFGATSTGIRLAASPC